VILDPIRQKCPLCGEWFQSWGARAKHIRSEHWGQRARATVRPIRLYRCTCGEAFDNAASLAGHLGGAATAGERNHGRAA
jgi:hypothetical protein